MKTTNSHCREELHLILDSLRPTSWEKLIDAVVEVDSCEMIRDD